MRRFLVGWAAVIAALVSAAPATAQFYHQRHPAGVAPPTVNHFSVPGAPQAHLSSPASAASAATQFQQINRYYQSGNSTILLYGGYPYWGGYPYLWTGAYTPAFSPYYNYYYYPTYSFGVPNAGAATMPAAPQAAAQAAPPVRNAPAPEPARPEPKVSTADQKAKAGRLIGLGDANFAKQKYFPAIDRYKSAAQMAADLPEPFFRQAFAMVAVGQYENAAKAFRRGLKIRSDWSNSPFRLDQLYEGGALAKTSHFETLAKAVEANPLDSDLLLVLGMQLFFDGHPERAGVFFTRVAQLGGNADRLLDDFLAKPAPAGAVGAKGQRAGKIVF